MKVLDRLLQKVAIAIYPKLERTAEFERNLPPEFFITSHAEERIKERIGCRKDKIARMVKKAWLSEIPVKKEFLNKKKYKRREYRNSIYKIFQGHVFIFRTRWIRQGGFNQKVLITVHSYKGRELKSENAKLDP